MTVEKATGGYGCGRIDEYPAASNRINGAVAINCKRRILLIRS